MTFLPVHAGLDGRPADTLVAPFRVARGVMTGVSLLALTLGMVAALPTGSARGQDTRTVINGGGGAGVILLDDTTGLGADAADGILASGGFSADAPNMNDLNGVVDGTLGNYSVSDKIFTNFVTQGGAGSGGGAGLGGVFFVDEDASLTLNNVDFTRNTVIGGAGGSDPAVDLGAIQIGLGDIDLPIYPISAYFFDPELQSTDGGATFEVSSVELTAATKGLQPGMRIVLPGTSTVVTITSISYDYKTLSFAPTAVPASLVFSGYDANDVTSGAADQVTFPLGTNLSSLEVGAILLIGDEKTALRVQSVSGQTVTLDGSLTAAQLSEINAPPVASPAPVQFLNLTNVDISQVKSVAGNTITFPGENGFFKPGMKLTGGEFGAGEVTVDAVDYVDIGGGVIETRVTVSGGAPPVNLTSFNATFEQVEAGGNTLRITNSRLFVGMKVSGAGVPNNITIQAINPDGTVTLSANLPADVKPEQLTFTGVDSVSGSQVTFVNAGLLNGVSEGMLVSGPGIPPGTTVASISGAQVTLDVPGGGGLGDVTALTFADETSLGGSMNDIAQVVNGSTGRDGNNAPASNVLWGDGEGRDGKSGDAGGDGTVGAGGTGGQGGNGSSGLQWSPEQIKAVVDTGIDAGFLTAEAAAALGSVPPDVAESVSVTLQAAKAYVDLGFEIGKLAEWYVDYGVGDNAVGGDGGDGGDAGGGDDFFGGGVGGAGGDGGDAGNTTNGQAGSGGQGGKGGLGGFGGGGGMGGAGGTQGEGVSASDGDGGFGGQGGFGGGQGSNGDGQYGEGGAGFGGAIFVRDNGTLLIEGNSTFNANRAEGGSSTNGGQAGNAGGADLFMMKGSNVTIRPGTTAGVDNVVVFNGTIGDDSRETFDEAANGRGFGADLTIGKGLVIFNGQNTYTGQTVMEGGVLQADDGWGLNNHSNLNFNGAGRTDSLPDNTNAGVLMSSGYFGRQLGTVGTHVQWTGSGGFAAKDDDLIVNIGNLPNPQVLAWGLTPGFFTGGGLDTAALVFGSEHADAAVQWLNPIDLGNLSRQVVVADNPDSDSDFAVMEGAISGSGGLIVGEAGLGADFWNGTLVLTGENTFTGDIELQSGTLAIAEDGTLATGVGVDIDAGATFNVMAEGLELGLVSNAGDVIVGEDLKAFGIDNTGSVYMMADIDLSPGFPFSDVDPADYNGDFFNNGPGAMLFVATRPESSDVPPDPADSAHTLTVDQFRGQGIVILGDPVADLNAGPQAGDDAPVLTIAQRGESTFEGVIMGAGGLTLTSSVDPADPTPPVPASRLTLTNTNTYFGPTIIDEPSTLALADDGSIALSESVQVDGTFDISAVTTPASVGTAGPQGTQINDLSGASSGEVVLGDKLLIVDNAASLFAGVISGTGDLAIKQGEQSLSGINTYTGETYVLGDAVLKLLASDPSDAGSPDGSIADSARVVVEGEFDISGTNNGASIRGLEGGVTTAKVTLGDEDLTITGADPTDYPTGTSFAGVISGTGGVNVTGGQQTLTNVNDYTGETNIGPAGALHLVGIGGIAESTRVTVDGVFDITGTTAGASIIRLAGTDPTALIRLGSQTLTLTGTLDSEYAGVITGDASSGLTIDQSKLTLTGDSPAYLGKTTIAADASLFLVGAGGITGSTVDLSGLFDIAGITDPGTEIADLYGDGEIGLGDKTLAVTDATGGTFSGSVTGTGALGVSGGMLNLDFTGEPTVNANIFAATGGQVALTGGTIDTTGSNQPALSVINGGVIETTNVALATPAAHPTASVLFNDSFDAPNAATNPAHIDLGAGTVLQNQGPLLVVTRDNTGATGNAFAGNVNFIIDNASVVTGDILDEDATRVSGEGSTTVYLGESVDWTGRAVAGDFLVSGGASAHFNTGSLLDNLYAGTGAQVDLSGNVVILGRFTLDSNGIVAPGSSPGTYNPNSFESNNGQETLWVGFGQADPQPGAGNDYSQINVAGDFGGLNGVGPGVLGITLERWNSVQATPLGNLEALELLNIGGTENAGSNVYLAERFTQHGHELLLDRRVRDIDPTTVVAGTQVVGDPTEDVYFDNTDNSLIVYGLRSIIQDETYGLATLTGTLHQAGRDTLGTFVERRGTGELETTWTRAGFNRTEVGDTVSSVQDLAYGQFGTDLIEVGDLRGGVMGSYSMSTSGVETETGTAGLQGSAYSGGVYATWASDGAYIDAVGQYGYSDWTFSPTAASDLTINGHTALAALEAGVRLGDEHASLTPWSQMVWQSTAFDGLDSNWVDNADFVDSESLHLRGGLRAEGSIGGFAPYLDLSVSHDLHERKTVTVDGFDFATGMGGTRAELGAGFQADISENVKIWSQVKGAYGIGDGTVVGYQGQAGMSASW